MPDPKTSLFEIEAHRTGRRDRSLAMGISPEYLSDLVDTFYGHIRDHDELGPIFQRAVGDNWGPPPRQDEVVLALDDASRGKLLRSRRTDAQEAPRSRDPTLRPLGSVSFAKL